MVVDKTGKVPGIILSLVKPTPGDDSAGLRHAATVGKVLLKECDTGNQKLTGKLAQSCC